MTLTQNQVPVVALKEATILPGMISHFDINRPISRSAVERAMVSDQMLFLIPQTDPDIEIPQMGDLYPAGVLCRIKQVVKLPRKMLRILVEGMVRGTLNSLNESESYLEGEVWLHDDDDAFPGQYPQSLADAMLRHLRELFTSYCTENHNIPEEVTSQVLEADELPTLADQIAIHMPLDFEQRQSVVEAIDPVERYEKVGAILSGELEIIRMRRELEIRVRERVDKNQKEYILREQLKVIREELGDDTTLSDIDNFRKALRSLKAKKSVKDKIGEEISRFQALPPQSPESAVLRAYIEMLLAMPWDKASRDNPSLKRAAAILDRDHYGLEDVKERVLEFLAVRQLTKKGTSPILCLVGPPGTGKTSIGRSIAEALGRKYVRISLGGVRDEAEIRGHRRTYVGAMAGRIATAMKNAGVKNPLMVLDEVDKVSSDYKGDVSSALLEVLDAEQNSHFEDHYIEIPIDLSEVLFVATANDMQTIPRPLLDRMEVIEVTSYTENEKHHIAREHLIPKQKEKNGIGEDQLTITDEALTMMISRYTREAGVRALERKIGEICRKTARKILEDHEKTITVTPENLRDFLGNERYSVNEANHEDAIGIVRGLAWTAVGGTTLQVEVNVVPGKGDFALTGMLGDVMKESARAGISYIRSVADTYGIKPEFFSEHDIHIHIPEGAVPKDGPSAGITMATAMLSAITHRPVRADVAMTGEITLRGRVLPIGGLKEKLLAARVAGIKKVLVPEKNRPDMSEISEEITGGLAIVYVESMEDVLREALA